MTSRSRTRTGRRSGGLIPRIWILDRLNRLKTLELGMADIERLVGAGVTMGGAKMFGLRPGGEGVFARPDRVRRIEHVIVALRPAQEMELEEPGHAVEMRFAREPHVFERALGALHDLEAVHGDLHGDFLLRWGGSGLATQVSLMVRPSQITVPGSGSEFRKEVYCLWNRLLIVLPLTLLL